MQSLWLIICVAAVGVLFGTPLSAEDGKRAPKPELLPRLTVLVLDSDGIAVAGAHVGINCHYWQRKLRPAVADADGFMYGEHCVTDASGVAQLVSPAGDLQDDLRRGCVIARQDERHLVAIADIDAETSQTAIQMTLVPECRVSGKLVCAELAKRGRTTDWTNVYLFVGKKRTMWCASEDGGDFHFFLPPGQYTFYGYGTYLQTSKRQSLVVGADKPEIALELAVPATRFALLRGLPAPELRDIVGWKNGGPLKLADLRGRCVVLDFWNAPSDPFAQRLPRLLRLHDRFAKQGLVVMAVFVDDSKTASLADLTRRLDQNLAMLRKNLRQVKSVPQECDIPCPIALARPANPVAVVEDYGIQGFPTAFLIDRSGNLGDLIDEDDGGIALVQKCLADKPAPQAKAPAR
jgi:AhpC/TSA family